MRRPTGHYRTGQSARIHTGEVLDPQHGLSKMPKWQAKTGAGRFIPMAGRERRYREAAPTAQPQGSYSRRVQ